VSTRQAQALELEARGDRQSGTWPTVGNSCSRPPRPAALVPAGPQAGLEQCGVGAAGCWAALTMPAAVLCLLWDIAVLLCRAPSLSPQLPLPLPPKKEEGKTER
jgi:hypothetical protein